MHKLFFSQGRRKCSKSCRSLQLACELAPQLHDFTLDWSDP